MFLTPYVVRMVLGEKRYLLLWTFLFVENKYYYMPRYILGPFSPRPQITTDKSNIIFIYYFYRPVASRSCQIHIEKHLYVKEIVLHLN